MAEETSQLEKLKLKIPYVGDKFHTNEIYEKTLNNLLEDSKNIALSEIYPFQDWSTLELPSKYNNWQIRASVELYNYDKYLGIISYSENGMSFQRDSSYLSAGLLDELMPNVGIPKRKETEGTDE